MKKILSTVLISAVLATGAFAGDYFGPKEKMFSIHAKSININDSGLDRGTVYGFSITGGDFAKGDWGIKTSLEFNYGTIDYKGTTVDTTYTELSLLAAPTYTFNCGARVYIGGKAGYAGFSDSVGNSDGKNGYILGIITGAEYPVMEHFMVGVEAELDSIYVKGTRFPTTAIGGYVGYKF